MQTLPIWLRRRKSFIASLTAGVAESAYTHEGMIGQTFEEISIPVVKFAQGCKMECKKIFSIGGMMYVPGVTTDAQKQAIIDKAKKQADDIIECLKVLAA